jgi:uncharacterized protein YuzE
VSLVPTYDQAVDALYLCARPGVAIGETVELAPRVIVDRDAEGVAIGVELLDAARHGIPTGLLARALGSKVASEQEIADAALIAIRGRPGAAGPG